MKKIVINGETIDNNNLQFPFFLYKNSTYVPLTPEISQILGLIAETDLESRTIKLLKTEPSLVNISENWKKNERKDIQTEVLNGAQVLTYELEPQSLTEILEDNGLIDGDSDVDQTEDAEEEVLKDDDPADDEEAVSEKEDAEEETLKDDGAADDEEAVRETNDKEEEVLKDDDSTDDEADVSQTTEEVIDRAIFDEVIEIPELSVRELDLGGMPVLTRENIIYLPLRVFTGENGLGWDVHFDPYTGIYVSTKEGIPAASYWNETESKYNQGLVNYILKCNGRYTENKAQELVFMFRNAAKTYNISEKVLMAVAHKESTFNYDSRGSGGSLGMMQVMPSTGARYGLGQAQLLDAETSINFGAMYLSERIAAYGGDLTKGFSAYNQGSVKVNRGSYSTRYANRVIETVNGIDTFLTSNGYGLGY